MRSSTSSLINAALSRKKRKLVSYVENTVTLNRQACGED
jgi:hypothetical protein